MKIQTGGNHITNAWSMAEQQSRINSVSNTHSLFISIQFSHL